MTSTGSELHHPDAGDSRRSFRVAGTRECGWNTGATVSRVALFIAVV